MKRRIRQSFPGGLAENATVIVFRLPKFRSWQSAARMNSSLDRRLIALERATACGLDLRVFCTEGEADADAELLGWG